MWRVPEEVGEALGQQGPHEPADEVMRRDGQEVLRQALRLRHGEVAPRGQATLTRHSVTSDATLRAGVSAMQSTSSLPLHSLTSTVATWRVLLHLLLFLSLYWSFYGYFYWKYWRYPLTESLLPRRVGIRLGSSICRLLAFLRFISLHRRTKEEEPLP